ncbi:hypothetical protein OTU49_000679 [Cherax quadricarinatus]|uniref:Chitin-binding type-2 domain-containing protein n=1 Tax=Cherax quadricarinatus TaxID=27406 RepID=A0AAW0XPM1_CHEQU|nr:proteoglycan 4-like [Cherax quadricarinatus]
MLLRQLWLAGLIGLFAASLTTAQENATVSGDTSEGAAEPVEEKPKLTGNPQIDYIHDPNLPHELLGYDLSTYPFYKRLPKDLLDPKFNFTCDNRHDGFYASIPHKCQVYHNCLFGVRYDFLCANYTVFDQKNFICHYVSEVDCENSEKHYDRNDELYETTTTTTSTTPAPQIIYVDRPRPRPLGGQGRIRNNRPNRPNRPRPFSGKRRTTTTTTPSPDYDYYDYYDNYDQYYDYYNDETTTTTTTTTKRPPRRRRPNRPRQGGQQGGEERFGGGFNQRNRKRPRFPENEEFSDPRSSRLQQGNAPREQFFDDAPVDEFLQDAATGQRNRPNRPGPKSGPRRKKPSTTTSTTTTTEASPDYYDYYDYGDEGASPTTTTTTTAAPDRRARPSFTPSRSSGSRVRPNTGVTTTEFPGDDYTERGFRPTGRINSNRQPAVINRRLSQADQTQDNVPEASTLQERQRPQPAGPVFPRRRNPTVPEADIIAEEEPLAAELEPLASELEPLEDTATEATRVRARVRVRPTRQGREASLAGGAIDQSPAHSDY